MGIFIIDFTDIYIKKKTNMYIGKIIKKKKKLNKPIYS